MDTESFMTNNNNINTYTDMQILLEITFRKQIKSLFWWVMLLIFVLPLIYIIYEIELSNKYDINLQTIVVWIAECILVLYIGFLAIFFHIEYFIRNRKEQYEIGNGQIIKYKDGKEKIYSYKDIDVVILYLTPPRYGSSVLYIRSHDNYHFVKIIMKSGEIIYLTSLLYPSGLEKILKEYMPDVPYYREKRWFPTTLY